MDNLFEKNRMIFMTKKVIKQLKKEASVFDGKNLSKRISY